VNAKAPATTAAAKAEPDQRRRTRRAHPGSRIIEQDKAGPVGKRRRQTNPRGLALAHPRFWPTWLGLGLLRASVALPLAATRALGRAIGRAAMAIAPQRRHITRVNLDLCLPELSPHERDQLVRRHFAALGESLFETAFAWWGPERRLLRLRRFRGLEHLETARAQGRGVILLTGHFLSIEIGGQLLAERVPLSATYAPPKNAVMSALIGRLRGRHLQGLIHHSDVRATVRALREGAVIGHIPDQGGKGIEARFFAQPTPSHVATAKLARMTAAPVVPYHPVRLDDGTYELRFEPALADFPGDDLAAATQRVNDTIEGHVRAAPDQYLWSHRRFKPMRKGDPDPYR
jgi:KDO2-lipid IV(A) lauroyltransferase